MSTLGKIYYSQTPARIACWIARIFALLLCLFWGAFFVEHLQEWFLSGGGDLPPAAVWIGQALHLVMILGLVMIMFRPALGAVVTVVGTACFFSWIGVNRFPYVALLNLLPIIFVGVSWALRRRSDAGPDTPRNGGPPAPLSNSRVAEGPPSVSCPTASLPAFAPPGGRAARGATAEGPHGPGCAGQGH